MIYLDNDVVHKLARCNLLATLLERLGGDRIQVLSTASFKFFARRPEKGVKRYGTEIHARICEFLSAVGVAADYPSQLERFEGIADIDPGEMILFAHVAEDDEGLLLTGDKRALRAVMGCEALPGLARKAYCLEQIVLALMDSEGFAFVRDHAVPVSGDTVLEIAFGSNELTSEETCREALEHYWAALRDETGELLADAPLL